MTYKERRFVKEFDTFMQECDNLFALLECDNNFKNAHRRVQSLLKVESELNALKEEICSMVQTNSIGNAKSKILSLYKKSSPQSTLVSEYNLDCSFLGKPSPAWKASIIIDNNSNWEKEVKDWTDKCDKWRKNSVFWYNGWLEEIITLCDENDLPPDETSYWVQQAHEKFKSDYLTQPYTEIWKSYSEQIASFDVIEKSSEVEFSECLPFIKDYAPRQLYTDLRKNPSLLGKISLFQFQKWEASFTIAKELPHDESVAKLRSLMRTICGGMLWRVIRSQDGWPNVEEENNLHLLLSNETENPASSDWDIDDSTGLFLFAKHFTQLSGPTPDFAK